MKVLKSLVLFSALLVLTLSSLLAQSNGTARGKVVDGTTGEPLLGATVRFLQGDAVKGGAYTDLEGAYSVSLPAGTYTLITSYISYLNDTLELNVEAGNVVFTDHLLLEETAVREDLAVEIVGKRSQASEVTLFNVKRTSVNTVDGVTLDQVRRTGDANVAAAMTRVVGVTVEGGKYVYVRGLGDRYSKTLLNGAEIPGLDPNRNTVQMDLFPSNLVDGILVYKNFTPNLPGSFSGGLVDVRTKDFPDRFSLRVSGTLGYNTQASLNDQFLADVVTTSDLLGFADPSRQIPSYITNDLEGRLPRRPATRAQLESRGPLLDSASRAFTTNMLPTRRKSGLNQNYEFSIGNQHMLGGRPFGYIASLTFRRNFNYYDGAVRNQYNLPSSTSFSLDGQSLLSGERGEDEALWGGLVKLSYKPFDKHKFSVNFMRNQGSETSGEIFTGRYIVSGGDLNLQTRTTGYIARAINVSQVQGDHAFGELKADWIVSYSLASQSEPDLRFFANEFIVNSADDSTFIIDDAAYDRPLRFYRNLEETNIDAKLNFSLPIPSIGTDKKSTLRFGGAYLTKNRSFNETRYEIFPGRNAAPYDGNASEYFARDNFGYTINYGPTGNLIYEERLFYQDVTLRQNVFDATQTITSGYLMAESFVGKRLKLVYGARYEGTEMVISPGDSTLFDPIIAADSTATPGVLSLQDILPSFSAIYAVNEKVNIRANYSRTLARPNIMEFSQFERLPFIGGPIYQGNPQLERTLITNLDLRWEWFFSLSEMVSVSAFYKYFENPIEVAQNFATQNLRFGYVNRESAIVAGVEFEVKKNLGFVGAGFDRLQIGANASFIHSETPLTEDEILNIQSIDPDRPDTRPLFGQSPYVFNTELAYIDREKAGLTASLNFNVFGPRLFAVGGAAPDIYEQPRPSLNFSISKDIWKGWSVRFRANNILNPEYKFTQTFKGQEFFFRNNTVGRTFSLGLTYQI
ncbi:MAG: TonB-dependent receptor [Bacteroidia bacterium]|nr:TonB-dependent receptor [Bacteroidia bacterium]